MKNNMRIKMIELYSFRIYQGYHDFNIENKKLIIIYGPNGNGKSTLFDALEWCITGEIKRFKKSTEKSKFNYLFNEEEYKKQNPEVYVSIEFEDEGCTHTIKRLIEEDKYKRTSTTKIIIDGDGYPVQKGNAKIQNIINNFSYENNNSDILSQDWTNFKQYFTSTQTLSQNELSNFLSARKPQERFKDMELILGIDRYGVEFNDYLKILQNQLKDFIVKDEGLIKEINKDSIKLNNYNIELNTKISEMKNSISNTELYSKDALEYKAKNLIEKFSLIYGTKKMNSAIDNTLTYELGNVSKRLIQELQRYKDVQVKLTEYRNLYDIPLKEYINNKDKFLEKNSKCKIKVEKRKLFIQTTRNQILSISIVKGDIKEFDGIKEKLSELNNEVANLDNIIKSIYNNEKVASAIEKYSDLEKFANEYRKSSVKRDILEKCRDYNELKKINDDKLNEINDLIEKQHKKEIEENYYKGIIETLEKEILKLNRSVSYNSKNEFTETVRNVQKLLIEDNNASKCPVCGEIYDSHTILVTNIQKEVEKIEAQLSELGKQKLESISEKSTKEVKYKELLNEIKEIKDEISEKRCSVNKNIVKMEELEVNIPLDIRILSQEEIEYQLAKEKYNIENEAVTFELVSKIFSINKEKDFVLKKIENQTNESRRLKNRNKRYIKYFEEKTYSLDRKETRLNSYLKKAQQFIKQKESEINEVNKLITELNLKINEIIQSTEYVGKLDPKFDSTVKYVDNMIEKAIQGQRKVEQDNKNLVILLKELEAFISQDRLSKLNMELSKNENELGKVNIKIKKIESRIEKNKKHVEEINVVKKESEMIRTALMGEFIEKYSDNIDELFFKISPHPYAKHVALIPRNGDLYILLSREKEDRNVLLQLSDEELSEKVNAFLTLSSAQLNILAVCIYMIVSMSQSRNKLDLMAIDDPFQNMDDINVFSFIDSLSCVLNDKQLIVSTHSEEIAALIKNKSMLNDSEIKTVLLKSYTPIDIKYEIS